MIDHFVQGFGDLHTGEDFCEGGGGCRIWVVVGGQSSVRERKLAVKIVVRVAINALKRGMRLRVMFLHRAPVELWVEVLCEVPRVAVARLRFSVN